MLSPKKWKTSEQNDTNMESKIRVILDTNLWISYLISKRLKKIDELFEKESIVLIFSQELLEEFIEVVSRPKFTRYFSKQDVEDLLEQFDYFGELIEVVSIVSVCRDEKDNFLLSLAKDGKADYLVTGDKDLLVLESFEGTKILTYANFEDEI